jgi:hypothetical protein
MAEQTILFTIMPRGMSLNSKTLPVSVLVSPRLSGSDKLGDYPDWLSWTQDLKKNGLSLTVRCGAKTRIFKIDQAPLRPELWAAMFNKDTYVRSYAFKDYTNRTIFSYPARLALSTLKSTYQVAGLLMGLPDRTPGAKSRDGGYGSLVKQITAGFSVNWNDEMGQRLRAAYRAGFAQLGSAIPIRGEAWQPAHYDPTWLAPDGTLSILPPAGTPANTAVQRFTAEQFALYTHMPSGVSVTKNPPDFDKLIDFHQALSSLNSYPELLRALGIVFDLDLPVEFVAETPINKPGELSVEKIPRHTWQITTHTVPELAPLSTAYLYFSIGDPKDPWKVFTTAPAILGGVLGDLEILGLLNLDPTRFGLAQVDLESGMFKNILLSEAWSSGRPGPNSSDHPQIFDESTTLTSLRSGGLSVFADGRALRLLKTLQANKEFNNDLEASNPPKRPFYAEDLVHGYRMDIWDSHTNQWQSLHRRSAVYQIGDQTFKPPEEVEGFLQLAAGSAAPDPNNPPPDDLYLNESMARWMGWSLSAPFPGKALSRDSDPDKALTDDPNHPQNEPATPFKMTTQFNAAPKSLPSLRFGRRYRLRMRAVDLCGNSMRWDDPLAALLGLLAGLPRDLAGLPYLRYEPVAAPQIVLRDTAGVTGPGSKIERLVIRTYNEDESKDGIPADLSASDRFIAPPSTSVEIGDRLGMFDDAQGKLVTSPEMYNLIGARDEKRFNTVNVEVAGKSKDIPLESGESIDTLPYLPDVLARGAALRDLPGSPGGSLAKLEPGNGAAAAVDFSLLSDANPRPGSAALVSFDGEGDWQKLLPFRLALADGSQSPTWDPKGRVLTVFLPKASSFLVPLSSYLLPDDLKLMGVWQWLREAIDLYALISPDIPPLDPDLDAERVQHLLQRAVEGGHWMITPPRILTLVHAVQQPIGHPAFTSLTVQHEPYGTKDAWGNVDEKLDPDPKVLQTAPEASPTAGSELSAITAWRKPGAPEAYLLGGLTIHAASTEKVDLLAEWDDPVDDPAQPRQPGQETQQTHTDQADEIPIPSTNEGIITSEQGSANARAVAYYDADHDLLCFVRGGDQLGNLKSGQKIYMDSAPRHYFNDTKYHRVSYTARSTSRFREYFPQDQNLDFTRQSDPIWVDVPASARPQAPHLDYVVPIFGWQRQTQTNLKRSVRFSGGLRIYLERPWFSSGAGEMLGVVLFDYNHGTFKDREEWKMYITQWGADPIWTAPGLNQLPTPNAFRDADAIEDDLGLPGNAPGRVAVAGYNVDFDYDRQKWYADINIDYYSQAYTPFIRLALARYQPCALPDAKLSAAVLVDYAQLTPERGAIVTADPYHPRTLRLTVSGPAPTGPNPVNTSEYPPTTPVNIPTLVEVTLQQRNPAVEGDLGWVDAPAATAAITSLTLPNPTSLIRWTGFVQFASSPAAGQYRLLVREYEYISAQYTNPAAPSIGRRSLREQPKRLIYTEAIEVDEALIGGPTMDLGTVLED